MEWMAGVPCTSMKYFCFQVWLQGLYTRFLQILFLAAVSVQRLCHQGKDLP